MRAIHAQLRERALDCVPSLASSYHLLSRKHRNYWRSSSTGKLTLYQRDARQWDVRRDSRRG